MQPGPADQPLNQNAYASRCNFLASITSCLPGRKRRNYGGVDPFSMLETERPMQDPDETIEIVSEEAVVEKRDVVTGKVRVTTKTAAETELVSAVLAEESVSVERVPINQDIEDVPQVRTDGDTTIIPVVEEVLVVEKRLVLREELHIRRTVSQRTVETPVTLRKQNAVIEREDGDSNTREEDHPNEPVF